MSVDLSFEELKDALNKIRGNCDHVPYPVTLYLWECHCRKVQELRIPENEMKKLKEDLNLFNISKESGEPVTLFGIKLFVVDPK